MKKLAGVELTNMYMQPLLDQTRLNVCLNTTACTVFDTLEVVGSSHGSRSVRLKRLAPQFQMGTLSDL